MNAWDAWACMAIGAVVGFGAREIVSGWAGIFRALAGEIRHWLRRKAPAVEEAVVEVSPNPDALTSRLSDDHFAIIDRWAQFNPWYTRDMELNREAQRLHIAFMHLRPDLDLEANLERVASEMYRRHPELARTRH